MGSQGEREVNRPTASLPLFSFPALRNIRNSGNLCSPLHTLASVPFRWEEQPGKPIHSSNSTPTPKCLDLPPRLLFTEASHTTVLDGPYNFIGRSISFSFLRKTQVSSEGVPDGSRRKSGGSTSTKGEFVLPSSSDDAGVGGGTTMKLSTVSGKRSGLGLSRAKSYFWATIYRIFKQANPRRSTK